MSVNRIGTIPNPLAGYTTGKTKKPQAENAFALQNHTVQKSQMPGGAFVLHYFDNEEGDRSLGAACGTDYSVTVYEPKDFDPANPVYKVKLWDKDGNVTERMVDVTKVDPANSDFIDMYAYSCYVTQNGSCPNAESAFMGADMGSYGPDGRTYKDLFAAKNWIKEVGDMMDMQYNAGNMQGYLFYKKFFDFLMKDKLGNEDSETGQIDSKADESESRSEVVVKPDGSKVLLVTTQVGGLQTVTSVELSKPDKLQGRGIQDGSIINDSVKNVVGDKANEQNSSINDN